MKFYTNCSCIGNNILYRGYDNGERIQEKVKFKPTLFLPTNKPSQYKTLQGRPCGKIEFADIADARAFVKQHQSVHGFNFYGNTRYVYVYLADTFPGIVEYDPTKIVVANIDIEVASEDGFASVEDPSEEITAITIKAQGRFYAFGCGKFETDREDVKYIRSKSEAEMLQKFLEFWQGLAPDVVTGWNVQFYDIPYIVNRISRVFSSKEAKRLSPWGYLSTRNANYKGRMLPVVEIIGICTLDYIELYRKFQARQESEKLNYIAYVELGEKKVDYSEYAGLHDLYKNNFQKFMEYNIKDVDLVDKLEKKLQLINMSYALAYDAKVNYVDVFTQVRMWDAIIFSYFKQKKFVLPQVSENSRDGYAGGYVKEIVPGLYNWVLSFDLNALYPMLMAQFNISPEMLLPDEHQNNICVDKLLEKKYDLGILKEKDISMAANGQCFRREKQGFLPEILMRMYEDRKAYKKKMLDAQKELELVKEELHRRGL